VRAGTGSPVAVQVKTTILPRVAFTTALAATTVGGTVCVEGEGEEGNPNISHSTRQNFVLYKAIYQPHTQAPPLQKNGHMRRAILLEFLL